MRQDVVRYEHFATGFDGERQVAAFWIAGPLKAIEARSRRQRDPGGHKPSGFELLLAVGIAIAAIALVFTLI